MCIVKEFGVEDGGCNVLQVLRCELVVLNKLGNEFVEISGYNANSLLYFSGKIAVVVNDCTEVCVCVCCV